MDEKKRVLSRFEAQNVAEFLRREKKVELPSGWVAVWKLAPADVVKKFQKTGVTEAEILKAARREVEEQG